MDYYIRAKKYIGEMTSVLRSIITVRLHNKDRYIITVMSCSSGKTLKKEDQFKIDFNHCIGDPTARKKLIEFIDNLDTLDEL